MVRLSGPGTRSALDRVFRPKNGRPMSRQEPRRLVLGDVLDRDGRVIDSALAVLFPGPGSYTGQDCGELQCHGSPVVLDAALDIPARLPPPPYLHVLGARKTAMSRLEQASLPVSTSLSDLVRTGPEAELIGRLHSRVVDFSSLCRAQTGPMGLAFTTKPVVL